MIRALYLSLSKWWGDDPVPAEPSLDWPQERLKSTQTWSRYFLVGNLIRAGTLSPAVGYAVSNRINLAIFILAYPLLVHAILILIELYKQGSIARLLPLSVATPYEQAPKYPDVAEISRHTLRLLPFETVSFYRAFGMEVFRGMVMWYVNQAMGHAPHVRFMDRSGRRAAIDYAMEACVAEAIHAKGAAINTVVLLLICREAPLWLNVWMGFWVFAEWFLVLLQRYMRVRVFVALTKRQGR